MLTYSFTNIGSDSLYQHLYKSIKKDIIQRNLQAGDKLPSKRSFAKNLGISVITVENAYAQLIAEGYIYSIPKKGFFVSDVNFTPGHTGSAITMENVSLSSGSTGYLADFTSNQADIETFPFSIWAKLVREVLNENQQELVTNPPSGGILPLRTAIARHLREFRDICVEPEQIIIGAGTEYLYGLLIQLLGFDKRYAVEDPGYKKIARIYEKHQVACSYIPMDESGIMIEELERSQSDIIHISPSHHFPTGRITSISRRYELLGWAAKSEQRYIIEDDYDSEFRMVGKPIPSMLNIDVSEKVIYMNTFTKTLASTVRISYMVLPRHLVNQFYTELSFYSCTVSNFEQYTLARFIQNGYFEKHINRMRNYYHNKRDFLLDTLYASALAPYVTITEEDSGLHLIMQIRTSLSDEDFCLLAQQHGIKIAALSGFYTYNKPENSHCFVINYSSVKEENIEKAIAELCKLIK